MIRKHWAVYGNVKMLRVYCKSCKNMTLVVKGIKLCCDVPYIEKSKKTIVMCEAFNKRVPLPIREKRIILAKQNNRCLYCHREFGTPYQRKGKTLFLKLCFDHLVPFSYSRNNENTNYVAACHICNGIKSNKMFETVEEVVNYVEYHRKKKGITYYEDLPSMSEKV